MLTRMDSHTTHSAMEFVTFYLLTYVHCISKPMTVQVDRQIAKTVISYFERSVKITLYSENRWTRLKSWAVPNKLVQVE